ncbi:MAG: type III-A CRISPR-associated protein Csm2 [Nitrospirae bacterium]|nr:MAG: type III-A CRISPR-associated protein Csm2 [Nitrospirota bacterium]
MEIKFWKDKDKKLVDPELFSNVAGTLAKDIAKESNDRTNTPTQLRKFYDEVIRFDGIIKTKPEEFDQLLPYIKMLNAKAAYAYARESGGKPLISGKFKDFISGGLKNVNSRDDFEVLASFFEAFMGFYKFEYEERKKEIKQQREQSNYAQNRGGQRR